MGAGAWPQCLACEAPGRWGRGALGAGAAELTCSAAVFLQTGATGLRGKAGRRVSAVPGKHEQGPGMESRGMPSVWRVQPGSPFPVTQS